MSFDPTVGAEIKKTRPALILQNDIANRYSPITIVEVWKLMVLLNQIRSVDKRRPVRRLGVLKAETLRQVERAILISFGMVKV